MEVITKIDKAIELIRGAVTAVAEGRIENNLHSNIDYWMTFLNQEVLLRMKLKFYFDMNEEMFPEEGASFTLFSMANICLDSQQYENFRDAKWIIEAYSEYKEAL